MLGKDGLTATSANHLANIAKEMYEAMETRLEAVKFYNRDYMLAVNNNTYRVENESGKDELETMKDSLKEIGQLKSLIACQITQMTLYIALHPRTKVAQSEREVHTRILLVTDELKTLTDKRFCPLPV